jgi:hypothetical protein
MGRLIGEYVALLYPDGIYGPNDVQIFPGLYSIVGKMIKNVKYKRS